jgi:hypothetical protein
MRSSGGYLSHYLVDTDVFLQHYSLQTLNDIDKEPVHVVHGINITPYINILHTISQPNIMLFYKQFTKLLISIGEEVDSIQTHDDIKDKGQLLCWIYLIQDRFL